MIGNNAGYFSRPIVHLFQLIMLLSWLVPAFAEYDVRLSTGFDYSTGDYGEENDTDILYIPFIVKLSGNSHSIKLTVPLIQMSDSGNAVPGGGDPIILDSSFGSDDGVNLGDLVLTASYYLYEGDDTWPMVDVNLKIKIPTADEDEGLGTGEWDYSLEADLTKSLENKTLFATLGRKFFGDPPGYDLDDAFYITLGVSWPYSDNLILGALFDARQATTDTGEGIREGTAYASYRFSKKWKCLAYLVKGFSDGSPDWGGGILFSRTTDLGEIKQAIPRVWSRLRF